MGPAPAAGMPSMSDIFLNYARPDRDKAARLAALLEARGWSVSWDNDLTTKTVPPASCR
jgi:hypothetical protein